MVYLSIAFIIFIAAVTYSGYDPERAELLVGGDRESYLLVSFIFALVWPFSLPIGLIVGCGVFFYMVGKSFRKK